MQLLRKDSTSDWGIGEEYSDILDGEPISKSMPIPRQGQVMGVEGDAHPADMLFEYQSTPGVVAVPILIDFANPDPFGRLDKADSRELHSSLARMEQRAPTSGGSGIPMVLIQFGSRVPSLSLSASPSLSDTSSRKRSGSNESAGSSLGSLNPFAAPWPLPQTTPKVAIPSTVTHRRSTAGDTASSASMIDSSLPLPKPPTSLPQRPKCPLPPVFVRRESAALPQPMKLPDVAPMGQGWEGEGGLSGNEKRRRASEAAQTDPGYRPGPLRIGRSMEAAVNREARPDHLVNLGRGLRKSLAAQSGGQGQG